MASAPVAVEAGMQPYPGCRLRRPLSRGGFGQVWEAELCTGEAVALKFLPTRDGSASAREVRAIRMVGQLRHPKLMPVRQVWTHPGHVVVAMDLAEGSLADLLEVSRREFGGPLPADQVCLLLAQVAEALAFLNARRHFVGGKRVAIQHCDVKPSNMLLLGEVVKLADFGLASPTSAAIQFHRPAGTLDYVPPEVFTGRLSDQSDQYSLAVSYCELRGGRLPFGDTPTDFDPRYVRPEPDLGMLDTREASVIARALSPVPQHRWPSCRELVAELARTVV
jgi:serine/threonine protein kinase